MQENNCFEIGDIVSYIGDLYEHQTNGVITNIIDGSCFDNFAMVYWFDHVGLITYESTKTLQKLT